MKPFFTNNKKQKDELVIKQDTEDALQVVLLKEYELTSHHADSIDARMFQFIAIALTTLTFIIGYMITQRPDFTRQNSALLGPWLIGAWFVPLFCLTMYSILIFQAYLLLAAVFNGRILSLRTNHLVGEVVLQHFERMSIEGRFFSTRNGSIRIRLLYLLMLGGAASLYPAIVFLAFGIIYQEQSHLAGTVFVFLYILLSFLLLYIVAGLVNELPQTYDKFLKNFNGSQSIPYFDGEKTVPFGQPNLTIIRSSSAAKGIKTLYASLLPRPADVVVKGPYFIYGFVAAIIISGLNSRNLSLLNNLFGGASTSWKSIGAVPFWAIALLCIIYFIIEEILLQQAKLIWDDIRDHERDKNLLRNYRRAIASGQMSLSTAKWQLLVRWLVALLFGFILGRFPLLIVFLLVCLHQMFYVLWAKPRSARNPKSDKEQRDLLFFVCLSMPLRFLAGVVSVAGLGWALSPYILFYVLFYFCSFGAMAAFWKIEAEHYKNEKQPKQFRPQSKYYRRYGQFWQYVGLLAAALVAICMVIIQVLSLSCIPLVTRFYGGCTLRSGAYHYIDYGPSGIILVLALIVLFGIISWGIVRPFRPIGEIITKFVGKVNLVFYPLFFTTSIVTFILLLLPFRTWNSILILFLGFFLLNVGYIFMFEGMTYKQYTNDELWKRLPKIKKALGYLLFKPDKNIGLRRLIIVAISDADPDKWENKKMSSPV